MPPPSQAALQAQPDFSKSVLSLVLSLSPLYFLATSRTALGLDRLHVGLLQVLILLVLKTALDYLPSASSFKRAPRRAISPPPPILIIDKSAVSEPVTTPTTAISSKKRRTKHDAAKSAKKLRTRAPSPLPVKAPAAAHPPPFPDAKLDETVANFLSITNPDFLAYIPFSPTTAISPAPLDGWTSTYAAADIEVLQHPTSKGLFGICATYPDVPLSALYEVLTDIERRPKWDSMTAEASEVVRWQTEDGTKKANVMRMCMKGMGGLVKAKDLILLSVPITLPTSSSHPSALPPTASTSASLPVSPILRIFAASTSVLHPQYPPTPEYNRMEVSISGFVIEEANGGKGSRICQITDLSGLGRWIPSAVINTITQTMLPKALIKLGVAAAEAALSPDESVVFPPPVLGAKAAPPPPPSASTPAFETSRPPSLTTVDGDSTTLPRNADSDANSLSSFDPDSEGEDEEDESEDDTTPSLGDTGKSKTVLAPSASRDLHALLTQLRSLTTRLTTLESLVVPSSSSASSASFSAASLRRTSPSPRPWYSPFGPSSSPSTKKPGQQAGVETGLLSEWKFPALFTVGSAAGAAIAVAAVAAWGRRAQR